MMRRGRRGSGSMPRRSRWRAVVPLGPRRSTAEDACSHDVFSADRATVGRRRRRNPDRGTRGAGRQKKRRKRRRRRRKRRKGSSRTEGKEGWSWRQAGQTAAYDGCCRARRAVLLELEKKQSTQSQQTGPFCAPGARRGTSTRPLQPVKQRS